MQRDELTEEPGLAPGGHGTSAFTQHWSAVAVMLAKLAEAIPRGDGWRYEPKWDGFRALAIRDDEAVHLSSRDQRPLQRYFPEVAELLLDALPPGCVLDGEIVLTMPHGLDFDRLQLRLHPAASRVRLLARQLPASFVAFDLLALRGEEVGEEPFDERRRQLELLLAGRPVADLPAATMPGSRLLLTPRTSDFAVGQHWFDAFEDVGLDGLMAKQWDAPYRPGERAMVKIKHRRTVDCVVGGYRREAAHGSLGSLLLGLYDAAGTLHYVGHTSSFSAAQRQEVLGLLRPLEGGDSFGLGRTPGGPSRWSRGREAAWVSVAPQLVCEVSYDFMQGHRFRHAARFEHWRTDKPPTACTIDQLGRLWRE
ncbi:MAG: ATP-dependent DNA ligase [Chloroflexota bacterium]